jgi:carbon starvation protein
MNGAIVLIGGLLLFYIGWRWYSKLIEKRLVSPSSERKTPANEYYDGLEYIPARTPLLFGHHFSNIAGAGPIIGPLVAASIFGWLPVLFWIVLGVIFIGGVHDYLVLVSSMRNKGLSVGTLAEFFINRNVRIVLSIFLLLALLLVVAVFAVVSAKTLVVAPAVVIPTLSIIPLAIIMGILVYRFKFSLILTTIITFVIYIFLIYLGYLYPIRLPEISISADLFWLIVLFLYGLLASLLPVGLLDQPRDYISTFALFSGMLLGILSLIIAHPNINTPPFVSLISVKEGPLWPMLFILVACGAISGFHALVSSGTTAKQLKTEIYQRHIGYGGMLLEGVLALMALLMVTTGLTWGIANSEFDFLSLLKEKGWIFTFGQAYGNVVNKAFPFLKKSIIIGFAMLMLNAFVLTTLDTAVRISRYLTRELIGDIIPIFKNRTVTTFVVIIPAFLLAITNSWKAIWPIFGASNQLIAALCLLIVSTYLTSIKKSKIYTVIPMIFMSLTTIAALIFQLYKFITTSPPNYLLSIISLILLILGWYILITGIKKLKKKS